MEEHIRYLTEYLDKYQIKVTGITAQKVPALAYIDDRAIHFNGNWNQVTAEVLTRLT
jgi:predicted phosphatase